MTNKYCCSQLQLNLEDDDVPTVHVEKFREFGVRVLDGGASFIAIAYCPWCGKRLPESLRQQWFDELERRRIDHTKDAVPEEFADSRWYQQLGL